MFCAAALPPVRPSVRLSLFDHTSNLATNLCNLRKAEASTAGMTAEQQKAALEEAARMEQEAHAMAIEEGFKATHHDDDDDKSGDDDDDDDDDEAGGGGK